MGSSHADQELPCPAGVFDWSLAEEFIEMISLKAGVSKTGFKILDRWADCTNADRFSRSRSFQMAFQMDARWRDHFNSLSSRSSG